jgi:hypothetical protein
MIRQGLFFGLVSTAYLFLIMRLFPARVWGYEDYSDAIKRKVLAQTKKEKTLAAIISLPWFVFILAFPVFSTFALKAKLGGGISIWTAFLNLLVLFVFATIGDLVILDWLIVSRLTPKFVIIPGTVKKDYEDFTHHYLGHAKAAAVLVPALLLIGGLISLI